MHDRAARKIERGKAPAERGVQEAAAAPDHVRERQVDDGRPQRHEEQQRAELHALGERTRNERGRDDGEHQLIDHEGLLRNRRRIRRVRLRADAVHERIREAADHCVAVREREAIAVERPDDGHDRHHREALHQGRQHVLFAHQSAVEQGETRPRHHEHQRRADQHPCVVARRLCRARGLFKPTQTLVQRAAALRQREGR